MADKRAQVRKSSPVCEMGFQLGQDTSRKNSKAFDKGYRAWQATAKPKLMSLG